jgi:hypothetical protein
MQTYQGAINRSQSRLKAVTQLLVAGNILCKYCTIGTRSSKVDFFGIKTEDASPCSKEARAALVKDYPPMRQHFGGGCQKQIHGKFQASTGLQAVIGSHRNALPY